MCYWFLDHGRCGEQFPSAKKEFLFISDEFVTTDNSYYRSLKKSCQDKPPSPKEWPQDEDFSESDYSSEN